MVGMVKITSGFAGGTFSSTLPRSSCIENWATGQLIFTVPGNQRPERGSLAMARGFAADQQYALRVVDFLHQHPALRGIEDRDFRDRPFRRVLDGADFQPAAGQWVRTLMRQRRIERAHAQGVDQPIGLDGHHLPGGAGGELIVAAKIHRVRLAAVDPEPEQRIVAAQIEFRAGQPVGGVQAEVHGTLKGDVRPQRRNCPARRAWRGSW